jgi:hypothetical protein
MLIFDNNIILFVEMRTNVERIHLLFDEDESLMIVLLDNLNSDLQWANLVMT